VDYIADLGRGITNESEKMTVPHPFDKLRAGSSVFSKGGNDAAETRGLKTERRLAIESAYAAIHEHEHVLLARIMTGLKKIPGAKIYGITDPARFEQRCATIAVRIEDGKPGHTPLQLATQLGDRGFFTWDGNYYALNLTEYLDVEKSGGFLRIGLVHYNTVDEVDRLLTALREITGR